MDIVTEVQSIRDVCNSALVAINTGGLTERESNLCARMMAKHFNRTITAGRFVVVPAISMATACGCGEGDAPPQVDKMDFGESMLIIKADLTTKRGVNKEVEVVWIPQLTLDDGKNVNDADLQGALGYIIALLNF